MLSVKSAGGGSKKGQYVWKKLTAEGGDFIDFVVSDDETAYPDGGEKDGYWYERFDNAVKGIDFGKVTLAETAEAVTVAHNLGVVPSWVAIIKTSLSSESSNRTTANINNTVIFVGPFSSILEVGSASTENTVSATEITFTSKGSSSTGNANTFETGTYYWFAIA